MPLQDGRLSPAVVADPARRYGNGMDARRGLLARPARRSLSVLTLNGHHELVIALAVISFAILMLTAVTSEGFTQMSPMKTTAATVAGLLTVVALAGLVAMLVVIGRGLFIGVMARLLH